MEVAKDDFIQREASLIMEQELQKLLIDLQVIFRDLPMNIGAKSDTDNSIKSGKYLLTNPNYQNVAKCMVTINGSSILEADLALKLSRSPGVLYQSRIYSEKPWRLQQIQDSMNQIKEVNSIINSCDVDIFQSSQQHVLNVLEDIMYHIKSAKDCLTLPKRKTLEELVKNPLSRCFNPVLPNEIVVSFYIQGSKLVMAVYHLYTNHVGRVDISNRHQIECVVPWLNDVLSVLTFTLWKCQQLKDKLTTLDVMKD